MAAWLSRAGELRDPPLEWNSVTNPNIYRQMNGGAIFQCETIRISVAEAPEGLTFTN